MTAETIHTCSYECDRPECIRAQRDELASRMTAETSNARGDVRGLVAEMGEFIDQDWPPELDKVAEWRDRLEAALAAEGVRAGEASAVVCLVTGKLYPHFAEVQVQLYGGYEPKNGDQLYTAPALSQQPEARGVVDEGSRSVTSQLLHWGGIPVYVTGTVTTSPGNWPLIDAALTEARNVR